MYEGILLLCVIAIAVTRLIQVYQATKEKLERKHKFIRDTSATILAGRLSNMTDYPSQGKVYEQSIVDAENLWDMLPDKHK